MKTVLIPIDFSDSAWKAAGYAANLYRNIPCEFLIVHTFHVPSSIVGVDVSAHISSSSKEINEKMNEFEQAFREFDMHPESVIKTVVKYGVPSSVIQDQVRENFVDIIIMGTTGASNNETVVLGSTTMTVLKGASCPILCIPEMTEMGPPKHIMFATDYHNVTHLDELLVLKEIAELQEAKISIVNVKAEKPVPAGIDVQLEGIVLHNFFGDIEHNYFEHQDEDVEAGILNFAHQKEVDLIVTMRRERGFWKGIFHRSVTKGLGLHSNIPLLVLKD